MRKSEEAEKAIRSLNYFKAAIDENIVENKIGLQLTGLESLSEDLKTVLAYIEELENARSNQFIPRAVIRNKINELENAIYSVNTKHPTIDSEEYYRYKNYIEVLKEMLGE